MVQRTVFENLTPRAQRILARRVRARLAQPGPEGKKPYHLTCTNAEIVGFYAGAQRLSRLDERMLRRIAIHSFLVLPVPKDRFRFGVAIGGFSVGFAATIPVIQEVLGPKLGIPFWQVDVYLSFAILGYALFYEAILGVPP